MQDMWGRRGWGPSSDPLPTASLGHCLLLPCFSLFLHLLPSSPPLYGCLSSLSYRACIIPPLVCRLFIFLSPTPCSCSSLGISLSQILTFQVTLSFLIRLPRVLLSIPQAKGAAPWSGHFPPALIVALPRFCLLRCSLQPPLWPNTRLHCVTVAAWLLPGLPILQPSASSYNRPRRWPTARPILSRPSRFPVLEFSASP